MVCRAMAVFMAFVAFSSLIGAMFDRPTPELAHGAFWFSMLVFFLASGLWIKGGRPKEPRVSMAAIARMQADARQESANEDAFLGSLTDSEHAAFCRSPDVEGNSGRWAWL